MNPNAVKNKDDSLTYAIANSVEPAGLAMILVE
jgi:hypothetical protein